MIDLRNGNWSTFAKTTVVGELSVDGTDIVLMATGVDSYGIELASRRIQLTTPELTPLEGVGYSVPYSWPAAIQLAFTFGEQWDPQPRLLERIQDEIKTRMSDLPTDLSFSLPEGLHARPYQVEGAHIIARLGNAIITDEPRTGKTITTILGLRQLEYDHGPAGSKGADDVFPIVCVVPAGTIDQWVDAFRLWWPEMTTVAWRGPKRERHAGEADVYVTSFETAARDAAYAVSSGKTTETKLLRLEPRTLVVDELHYIANPGARRSKAVLRLGQATQFFVGLGGTPIKKHIGDFWSTLATMVYEAWPSKERWDDRVLEVIPGEYGEPKVVGIAPYRQAEFDMCLLGQTRRVTRKQVLPDLPDQFWTVRMVEVPKAWRKAYDDFEADMIAELPIDIEKVAGATEEELEQMSNELTVFDSNVQFGHLTRLASSACEPEVWFTTEEDPETGGTWQKRHISLHPMLPSWKIDELLKILAEREDEQVLVYGPYKKLVDLALGQIIEAGFTCGQIVGGQTSKQRTKQQQAFQAGELQHMVATTGAGGVGLTLNAAGTIVHLQRDLSMVNAIQADDRNTGIGSEKHAALEVIDIVAADTIESRVRDILHENAGQLGALLKDPTVVARMLGGITRLPKLEEKAS